MKYVVFLGDGMADTPIPEIDGKTPLMVAKKPNIDSLAPKSEIGLAKTVPDGMKPGSDTANLSVMGYDPRVSYSGRSPLEALSMGLVLSDTDIAVRCNLVTLSDEEEYADKRMIDYSAGEISTEEARELILYVEEHLGTERISFHPGISYRHCLIVHNAKVGSDLTPPHDITGKPIKRHLPTGELGDLFSELMIKSYDLLKDHPINQKRIAEGKNPANSIWLWGEGTKPSLPDFKKKNGITGAVISAVDLLKGIGKGAGMEVIEVKGATGNVNTDFAAKGKAAIDALSRGVDYVYIHVEAADESGHQGNLKDKIYSIEKIDADIVGPVMAYLKDCGEEYHVLVCPDHPTPIATRTHSPEPVPYLIYKSDCEVASGVDTYDEQTAKSTGIFVAEGYTLIDRLLSSESEVEKVQGIDPDIVTTAEEGEIVLAEKADDAEEAEAPLPEEEEPKPEKKKKGSFKDFFKRHLLAFIIVIAAIVLAGGLAAGHFIATYHLGFVHSEEGLTKAATKDRVTTIVLKKDVTLSSDLVLDRTVNIDLNKHTLTVEGDIILPLEKSSSIGYKKGGKYIKGGKIVANKLTASGTNDLLLYADLEVASAEINAAKIEVQGNVTATASVSMQSESIQISGNVNAALSLAANSALTLCGNATEVNGGKTLTLKCGTVGSVIGTEGNRPTVYVYEGANAEKIVNVENFYRVTRLAAPSEILVLQENGDFFCYVSEVIGATKFAYTLNGVEKTPVDVTPGTTVIQLDSDSLTPGKQKIVLRAIAPDDPRFLDSEEKTCTFEFSAKLADPIPTVAEEEGKIVLTIPAVKHADKYLYTVDGKSFTTKEVKTDISDKVTSGGVHIIKVKAQSENKYFSESNEAMTGYVTYLTLAAPLPTAVKEEDVVTFTWDAVENASSYYVTYGEDKIYTTATSLVLPYVADAAFGIQAKGASFHLDSAVTTLTAAEILTPAA